MFSEIYSKTNLSRLGTSRFLTPIALFFGPHVHCQRFRTLLAVTGVTTGREVYRITQKPRSSSVSFASGQAGPVVCLKRI
jgi:hypothetical protein